MDEKIKVLNQMMNAMSDYIEVISLDEGYRRGNYLQVASFFLLMAQNRDSDGSAIFTKKDLTCDAAIVVDLILNHPDMTKIHKNI